MVCGEISSAGLSWKNKPACNPREKASNRCCFPQSRMELQSLGVKAKSCFFLLRGRAFFVCFVAGSAAEWRRHRQAPAPSQMSLWLISTPALTAGLKIRAALGLGGVISFKRKLVGGLRHHRARARLAKVAQGKTSRLASDAAPGDFPGAFLCPRRD